MAWVPVNFQTVSQIAIEILNISCAKSFLGTKNFCRTTNWMGMLFMLREYMNGQGVSISSGTTVPNITSSNPPPLFFSLMLISWTTKYTNIASNKPPFFFPNVDFKSKYLPLYIYTIQCIWLLPEPIKLQQHPIWPQVLNPLHFSLTDNS